MREPPSSFEFYRLAVEQWRHTELSRWSVLSSYLLAVTVLLLAWGAVYVSGGEAARGVVLSGMAVVGCALSLAWIALADRANQFANRASKIVSEWEMKFPEDHRIVYNTRTAIQKELFFPGKLAPSWVVVRLVPTIFAALFLLLVVVSAVVIQPHAI